MSLTSELDDTKSPVNLWFDAWLPNTDPVRKEWNDQVKPVPVRRPATDRQVPGTVGTAFDYRARYYLAVTPVEQMVAGIGMRLLDSSRTQTAPARSVDDALLALYGPPPETAAPAIALLEPFREALSATLERIAPTGHALSAADESALCRYCYVLAWFEELYRAGSRIQSPLYTLLKGATLDDLLALPEDVWIDDLCQLSSAFAEHLAYFEGERVVLNPIFGGSTEIGGADADLIVDGCLIDLKTTINPRFIKRRLLYQLLGYVLLDYDDQFAINAAAVYLSRQGLLVRFELDALLTALAGEDQVSLPALRASFREAVLTRGGPTSRGRRTRE